MEKNELKPIVLENDIDNVADILAGSEIIDNIYIPDIACGGVGASACKEGCLGGCKDTQKKGRDCSESCKSGCQEGCLKGCKSGNK